MTKHFTRHIVTKQKRSFSYLKIIKLLPIIELSVTATTGKNIPGLTLLDQSCNVMQIYW